jgi:DNA polymerase III alpha subunit (gram-positive type)
LVNHHRAGDDARATAQIFVNLLSEMVSNGVHDLAMVRSMGKRKFVYA